MPLVGGALEGHGYVMRSPDAVDARALLIELTPRGREADGDACNAIGIERDWRQALGRKRLDEPRETLQILLSQDSRAVSGPPN